MRLCVASLRAREATKLSETTQKGRRKRKLFTEGWNDEKCRRWEEFEETVEERNYGFDAAELERAVQTSRTKKRRWREHRRDQPIFANERKVSLEDGNVNKGEMSRAS